MVDLHSPPPVARLLRRAAGFMPSSVSLISHGDVVMTVSTLQCLSFDPPIVSVFFDHASQKGRAIREAGRFFARVLRATEAAHAPQSTSAPSDQADQADPSLVALDCEITRAEQLGDHFLVLASVARVRLGDGAPLVYWRRGFHLLRLDYPFLATPAAFAAFIAAWEAGTLPHTDWTHAAHVAVAACYAVRHGAAALNRTRAGIVRYNTAAGTPNTDTSGYHETLTRFWAEVVARLIAGCDDEWAAARLAVERLGEDRDLHAICYAFDVSRSREARRSWVAPDWPITEALPLTFRRSAGE
ncbi:MAG: flavin reductase [Acidobacteria bacterium]|nr:flavin reductase [Acidobacteriota bacterium]